MQNYLNLLDDILHTGIDKADRTGTGTVSNFGTRLEFNDIQENFPILTTKFIPFKLVLSELLWFISGSTNVNDLKTIYKSNNIWNEWASVTGELGPIYGKQWRNWNGIDQLDEVITSLKTNPHSRRHIVSAWNVKEIPVMELPPCHCFFQFYVDDDGLECQVYQRSCDMFLGVPFNIASYALLTCIVAQLVGLRAKKLIWVGGDTHIYSNHFSQVGTQLRRKPYKLPTLWINPNITNIDEFEMRDFLLDDYVHHPHISAPISV